MKILAIESSSITASAAIINDDILTAEYTINHKKTHSQTLLPMIDEICRMTETDMNTLDAVAVSEGPGSYTGLRIGSSTGKGIGLALDIPLLSVPTLEAMAYNMYGDDSFICPMIDARRRSVYTGIYRFEYHHVSDDQSGKEYGIKEELLTVLPQCLVTMEELIEKVNNLESGIVFIGDAVPGYSDFIRDNVKVPYMLAPVHMNSQRAASVAMYGKRMIEQGKTMNAREHVPEYLRPSQAERELHERNEAVKDGSNG